MTPIPPRLAAACLSFALGGLPLPASAAAPSGCLAECHANVAKGKFVHVEVADHCETCHGAVEMKAGPHPETGRTARGLVKDPPALCQGCHDRKEFEGKVVHAPVDSAPCSECHFAHASDNPGLLRKDPTALCLDCHDEVARRPHFVAGFAKAGHPVGIDSRGKAVADPLNANRPYSCVSCHEPHRSKFPRLLRMDKNQPDGFCWKCHRM